MIAAQKENERYRTLCENLKRLQNDLQEMHGEAERLSTNLVRDFMSSNRWQGEDRDSCWKIIGLIDCDIIEEKNKIDAILASAYKKADAKRVETANRLIQEIYPNLDAGAELHARWDYFTK